MGSFEEQLTPGRTEQKKAQTDIRDIMILFPFLCSWIDERGIDARHSGL
jgi:hypothetical protein